MKKLILLFVICAASVFAQNSEVFGGVGVSVLRQPTVAKVNAGVGYGYFFAKPYAKTFFDEVTVGYGYTAPNAHTALVGAKRNMKSDYDLVGLFIEVDAGTTTFVHPTQNITKFTAKSGLGMTLDLQGMFPSTKGVSLSFGGYLTKVASVPLYFSTGIGISKTF